MAKRHLSVGLALGLLLASYPSASVAGSTPRFNCHASFNAYRVSSQIRTECGIKAFPLLEKRSLPGGGSEYVYEVEGFKTVRRIPPTGFNPINASNATLAEYMLPERPVDPSALADWTAMMSNFHLVPAEQFLLETTVKNANPPSWAGEVGTSCSPNCTFVEGQWDEESIGPSCSNSAVSNWAGLGGYGGSHTLGQDGTAYGEAGVDYHQAWWEILPASASPIGGVYGYPGWRFTAETQWVGNGYYFYVYDSKYGDAWNGTEYTSSFDGTHADFVVERPIQPNGSLYNLANFYWLKYHNAWINGTGSGNEVWYYSPVYPQILNNNNKVIAYPSNYSPTDPVFKVNYVQCN